MNTIAGAVLVLVVLGIALYAVLLASKLFKLWRLTRSADRARSRQDRVDARIRDSLQLAGFKGSEIEDALRDFGRVEPLPDQK